ncbi:hypothetical protein KM043_017023 [Ampulex compressa]|nr:hypothetical protein KM043_017023 [Ampulex compressa]
MDRILRIVVFLLSLQLAMQQEVGKGKCTCAVFGSKLKKSEPIVQHNLPYNVTCNQDGQRRCEQLCIALAESAIDNAPELICEQLNIHVDNMEIELHAKVCLAAAWKFTGMKTPEPICCHGGMATTCAKEKSPNKE